MTIMKVFNIKMFIPTQKWLVIYRSVSFLFPVTYLAVKKLFGTFSTILLIQLFSFYFSSLFDWKIKNNTFQSSIHQRLESLSLKSNNNLDSPWDLNESGGAQYLDMFLVYLSQF